MYIREEERERLEPEKSSKKVVGTFECEVEGSAPKRRKGKFGGFFEKNNETCIVHLEERTESKEPRVFELSVMSMSFELGKRRMVMKERKVSSMTFSFLV